MNVSKALRHIVFERDSYTCILCTRGATDCHHVIPRSRGGRNNMFNLVSLCREHHMSVHGNMNLDHDALYKLKLDILMYISDAHPMEFNLAMDSEFDYDTMEPQTNSNSRENRER